MNNNGVLNGTLLTVSIVIGIVVFVVFLIAYTNIIARAGYSRWWILIMLVPIANIVFLLFFCFADWPILRELRALRAQVHGGYGNPYQQGGYQQPGR